MKRLLSGLLLLALVVAFFAFDLQQQLNLNSLKQHAITLSDWQHHHPISTSLIFFGSYVLTTALSLPGATLLTLLAGALFGLLWGTLLVSFASSLGALGAFLASRYLLREWVQTRFAERLKAFNTGIEKEGRFYLFTLRLVPVVPFFLINLLMGLTPMRGRDFYWVSQLGMLAGTLVYVNAGTQLAELRSTSDILSPGLWLSFTLLATFPWLAKALLQRWRRRQRYAAWRKPRHFDRNLIVIGAGAAGLVSAYIAAAVKAKVTLIETHKMGGDCLNYGCVPSKALIKSAKIAHQIRHADRYGLAASEPSISFRQLMSRVQTIIAAIAPHDSIERYTALGVEVLHGHARLLDPWTVAIRQADGSEQRLSSASIIIATGAAAIVPPLPGIETSGYLTSDTLWETLAQYDSPPDRVVVLGGGPMGSELSQALARLGSRVTQIEMGPRLLAREDPEVSALAAAVLRADGVQVLTDHQALSCGQDNGQHYLQVSHAGSTRNIDYDLLICAIGRRPRLSGYGLEALGIATEHNLSSNDYLQTLYPNIYAAGDVSGQYPFTHVAAHQAWYASINALFGSIKAFKVDNRVIPWTTFIDPEIARVGLNEQDAQARGIAYEVTCYPLHDLDRAITDSETQGFVKVLTPPGKDRILGVTIAGAHGAELLAEFVFAMKWRLGLNKILATIHTYPSFAEANKYAAGAWKRAHTSPRLLALLARFHRWRRHS